jgi:CDP-diacylglycerol--glycerol-3-phosphate 3-phosphatidyltransferase
MKITANQVTIARVILLPIPTALVLYADRTGLFIAMIVGTIIGATDALDGWMARRDGPTVLGAFLDPTADKLFVAALLFPFAATGYCPPWVAGGIFFRELLITGLRTSMEIRQERLKTSQLGKLKTVVQMGGLGVFYFTAFLPTDVALVLHGIGTGTMLVILVYFMAKKRKRAPFWVEGALPLWGSVALLLHFRGVESTIFVIFILMLILTWVSGIDYLVGSARVLKKLGVDKNDLVRVIWAAGYGVLATAVAYVAPEATIPGLFALAGALSVGGIDNVVSAQAHRGAHGAFGITGFIALAAGAAIFFMPAARGMVAVGLTSAVALIACVDAVVAFQRDREVFR